MGSRDAVGRHSPETDTPLCRSLTDTRTAHRRTAMIARNCDFDSNEGTPRERHETRSGYVRRSAAGRFIRHGSRRAGTWPRALRNVVHATSAGEIRPRPRHGAFVLLS